MAEDGKVVFKIEGDASQAMQAVDQFEKHVKGSVGSVTKSVETGAENAKKSSEKVKKSGKDVEKQTEETASAYDKLTQKIKTQQDELGKVVSKYKSVVLEQGENSAAAKKLESEISKLNDELTASKDRLSEVDGAADQLTGNLGKTTTSLERVAKAIGAAFATKKIIEFGKYAVGVASDLSEVQNVVDTTFGQEGAQRINEWAVSAAEAFGESELQAKQFTSTIGAMFKSMGVGQKDLEEMSIGIAGLAGDMASFYNLDVSEAFEKLRAGISGETEPLKQLGINMNIVNLEAYAMSQGITTAYEEMSQAEQATLRYQYIMQATADAQGDFSKTSDSFANQTRILQLEMQTLAAEIGEDFMPIALELVDAARDAIQWGTEHKEVLEAVGGAVVALTTGYIALKGAMTAKSLFDEVSSCLKNIANTGGDAKTSIGNLAGAFDGLPGYAGVAVFAIGLVVTALEELKKAQEEALNKQLEYMDSLTTYADLQANGDLVMTGGTWNEETKMWEGVTTKPTASAQKAIAAGTYQNAERTALGSAEGRTFWTNNFGSLYAIAGAGAQTSAGTSRHQSGEDFVMADWTPAFLDYGERVLTRQENLAYTAMGGVDGMARASESTGATAQKTDVDVKLGFTVSPREMAHVLTPYVIDEMKRTRG